MPQAAAAARQAALSAPTRAATISCRREMRSAVVIDFCAEARAILSDASSMIRAMAFLASASAIGPARSVVHCVQDALDVAQGGDPARSDRAVIVIEH